MKVEKIPELLQKYEGREAVLYKMASRHLFSFEKRKGERLYGKPVRVIENPLISNGKSHVTTGAGDVWGLGCMGLRSVKGTT